MIKINRIVFYSSAIFIFALSFFMLLYPAASTDWLNATQIFMSKYFSWYYMLLLTVCMLFTLWLAFSPYGKIRLGNCPPEYSFASWMFMLFSSGIGIAIVYYGCYEPVEHYINPPSAMGSSASSAQYSLVLTFLHWGVHGWALYSFMAVVLGYFTYVKGYNLEIRSPLYSICNKKYIDGFIGNIVDSFAVVATVIAMVTNCGFGALLVKAGLVSIFHLPDNMLLLISILIIMTILSIFIALLGIKNGIAVIANWNIYALCLMLFFVFCVSHSAHLLDCIVQNTGDYLVNLPHLSFELYIYEKTQNWRGLWTIFYWAWWVSWAPFVGLFIAQISKGRTIRELILATLILPLSFTLLWLSIFGNSVLYSIITEGNNLLCQQIMQHPELAIFNFLKTLPLSKLLVIITTIISIILFFSPVDSGCIVISELSIIPPHRNGEPMPKDYNAEMEPPIWLRIFWCFIPCLVTIGLFINHNLDSIQTTVMLFAFPFTFVIIAYMIAIYKDLKSSIEK